MNTQTNTTSEQDTATQIFAGALVLADGSVFEGEFIGAQPQGKPFSGEVVFNTSLTGYQEVISDPSYAGQIVSFTYPHIGNYGVTDLDQESNGSYVRGIIVRDLARRDSNWRSQGSLEQYLIENNIGGLGGLDTRRLTRILRDVGAMPGAFGPIEGPNSFDLAELKQAASDEPGTDGIDLVEQVTCSEPYTVGSGSKNVVAYDYGIKKSILNQLANFATVTVVPANWTAEQCLELSPDGVFLSNGPGDPREVPYAVETVKQLLGKVPIFGICLGHQILCLAIGGTISKLPYGHHGANHPLRNELTGEVEITSQNHNFAVEKDSIEGVAEITHINLNDGVCEGLRLKDGSAFSVQHHPEASPGPHDSAYLFIQFKEMMN